MFHPTQQYTMELRVRVMSLEETRRTQRPYRYGMMLLCVGALVNWLGLAENYSEPVRYAGVACILGACLICTAMCCWLHTPGRSGANGDEVNIFFCTIYIAIYNSPLLPSLQSDDPVHVISTTEERRREKPPDYDTVAAAPPSYDDAIKLDPAALLRLSIASDTTINSNSNANSLPTEHPSSSQTTLNNGSSVVDVANSEVSQIVDSSMAFIDEKMCPEKPPPYLEQPISSTGDEQTSRPAN
ncbi:uncharacterized protein LOC128300861 isoform X2 [Anopheles moucheti]|uniref:uncharacterized protein LOC128300861 isoform X2 n=1 Tax=Anopheles moucheti TaxID=186751 RepID=UPI0022EFD88D|nr:uncharacterized protein LOC128300861 isoform X2 [Anopheles moucheti]